LIKQEIEIRKRGLTNIRRDSFRPSTGAATAKEVPTHFVMADKRGEDEEEHKLMVGERKSIHELIDMAPSPNRTRDLFSVLE